MISGTGLPHPNNIYNTIFSLSPKQQMLRNTDSTKMLKGRESLTWK